MKLTLLSISIFLITSCFGQQTNETIDIGGTTRSYVQYLPTGFNPQTESLPVVFCLHGLGDVATNMANIGFNQMADTARFIVIYPQGVTNSWGQNSWNNATLLASTEDDISFFNQLMDSCILSMNADPTRIYSCGLSMGGIMSYHLACELNGRIAAIGSMSGTMATSDISTCVPAYKTPVIHFHGTADATVPYDSGALPSLSLVPETIDFWTNVHTCLTTADSTQIPDVAADGLTVDRFVYQGCDPLASVELWRINGGTHTYFYQPANDFTEAIEIWRFFYQWSNSNPTPAGIEVLQVEEFRIINNPVYTVLELEMENTMDLRVYSVTGELMKEVSVQPGINSIDCTDLKQGVYYLSNGNQTKRFLRL